MLKKVSLQESDLNLLTSQFYFYICNFKSKGKLEINLKEVQDLFSNISEINSCVPNPCANGGTCTATVAPNGKDAKFTCACSDWYKGANCECKYCVLQPEPS